MLLIPPFCAGLTHRNAVLVLLVSSLGACDGGQNEGAERGSPVEPSIQAGLLELAKSDDVALCKVRLLRFGGGVEDPVRPHFYVKMLEVRSVGQYFFALYPGSQRILGDEIDQWLKKGFPAADFRLDVGEEYLLRCSTGPIRTGPIPDLAPGALAVGATYWMVIHRQWKRLYKAFAAQRIGECD